MTGQPEIPVSSSEHHRSVPEIDIVAEADDWTTGAITNADVTNAVQATFDAVGQAPEARSVTILLTSDARIAELNSQFRKKFAPTNVLSFPSGEDAYLGDIALAYETVAREANTQHITMRDHVSHLVIHGVLHLLGYDHEDDAEARDMEHLEITILGILGVNNPYAGTKPASGLDSDPITK